MSDKKDIIYLDVDEVIGGKGISLGMSARTNPFTEKDKEVKTKFNNLKNRAKVINRTSTKTTIEKRSSVFNTGNKEE